MKRDVNDALFELDLQYPLVFSGVHPNVQPNLSLPVLLSSSSVFILATRVGCGHFSGLQERALSFDLGNS
jgi:hypothetical protein